MGGSGLSGCSQYRRLPGLCLGVSSSSLGWEKVPKQLHSDNWESCVYPSTELMYTTGVLCYRNEDTHCCLAHSMPAPAFHNARFGGIPVAALQGNTFRILACTSQEGWKFTPSDGKPSEFCPLVTPRLHFSTNSAVCWWLGHVTCLGGRLPTSSAGLLLMPPGQLSCQAPPPRCRDALW